MTDPDVVRIIGEMTDRDNPMTLAALRRCGAAALRREIAQMWPGDRDAQILPTVIATKIRRLQQAN